MVKRNQLLDTIQGALNRSRIVALIGPRQCGKTTIARHFVDADSINYFDLEDPVSLARLNEPMTALKDLRRVVVIDEIQRTFPTFSLFCGCLPTENHCRPVFSFLAVLRLTF